MPDWTTTEFKGVHEELRDEIGRLARVESGPQGGTEYPDPASLNKIDRRLLARSVFAFIDAMAYQLKQDGLNYPVGNRLSSAERTLCAEESYELSQNGEIEPRPARLRFLPNLRFAFRVVAKAAEIDFSLDVSGSGWDAVRDGVRVRDRLMHPKRVDDLIVTDDEIRTCLWAFIWIENEIMRWLLRFNAKLRGEAERLMTRIPSETERRKWMEAYSSISGPGVSRNSDSDGD